MAGKSSSGDDSMSWSNYLLHGQDSAIHNTFIAKETVFRAWRLYSLPTKMQHQCKVYYVGSGAHHALDTRPFCVQAVSSNKVFDILYGISKKRTTTFTQFIRWGRGQTHVPTSKHPSAARHIFLGHRMPRRSMRK